MAYVDFKDLPRRMVFKKVFNIIMVWWISIWKCFNTLNIFDKKSATCANKSAATCTGMRSNSNSDFESLQLAKEFHNPIFEKIKKCPVYLSFKDSIWGADLAGR